MKKGQKGNQMGIVICGCGGTCKFQGDVGEIDEWKCKECGTVYGLAKKEGK